MFASPAFMYCGFSNQVHHVDMYCEPNYIQFISFQMTPRFLDQYKLPTKVMPRFQIHSWPLPSRTNYISNFLHHTVELVITTHITYQGCILTSINYQIITGIQSCCLSYLLSVSVFSNRTEHTAEENHSTTHSSIFSIISS